MLVVSLTARPFHLRVMIRMVKKIGFELCAVQSKCCRSFENEFYSNMNRAEMTF